MSTTLAPRGATREDAARPASSRRTRRVRWWPFAIPAVALVGVFFLVPLLLNAGYAFTSWTTFTSAIRFNGFDNFAVLLEQGYLGNAIRVTLLYAVIAMTVQNVVSIVLAMALRDATRLNGFFRTVFFLPVLISPLAAGYIWRGVLDPEGPLNAAISGLTGTEFAWAWLGEPATALASVAFIDAWKWSGLTTLVYIAGINAVPRELIEAATIDGASAWRRFRSVILPLLAPAMTFNIAVTLVGALSAYDIIAATTGGGPGDHTRTLNILMRQQFGQGYFGTGSALSLVVTVLVIVIAVPLVRFLRSREVRG